MLLSSGISGALPRSGRQTNQNKKKMKEKIDVVRRARGFFRSNCSLEIRDNKKQRPRTLPTAIPRPCDRVAAETSDTLNSLSTNRKPRTSGIGFKDDRSRATTTCSGGTGLTSGRRLTSLVTRKRWGSRETSDQRGSPVFRFEEPISADFARTHTHRSYLLHFQSPIESA